MNDVEMTTARGKRVLNGITCVYHSVYVPKVWCVDEIGDKHDDR